MPIRTLAHLNISTQRIIGKDMYDKLSLDIQLEEFPYKKPFRISGHEFIKTTVLVAELRTESHCGRGEAAGVYYNNEGAAEMVATIEGVRAAIENGATRQELQNLLPPGGARNALDCAFWDLEAKISSTPVWKLANIKTPQALKTTLTIGADTPEKMAEDAVEMATATALKLKLTGEVALDAERLKAVRQARPKCWIGVDANQGYPVTDLPALYETLLVNSIAMLEQPLATGRESDMEGLDRPIPTAADESALSLKDVESLVGRFDIVNIKLDKCGGLTEALKIEKRARELGLGVMVGNMMGTSLAMAPSYILGQICDIVDLDGPTFLAQDRVPSVKYENGNVLCPLSMWGAPE